MKTFVEIESDRDGYMPPFGELSKEKPLIIEDSQMPMIEAKTKKKLCEIAMPQGVELTFVIESEDKSEG